MLKELIENNKIHLVKAKCSPKYNISMMVYEYDDIPFFEKCNEGYYKDRLEYLSINNETIVYNSVYSELLSNNFSFDHIDAYSFRYNEHFSYGLFMVDKITSNGWLNYNTYIVNKEDCDKINDLIYAYLTTNSLIEKR